MSLNLAFFVLLVLIAVYLIFIEIFTIIFMMTGLSHQRSVFQVISLLTNSGFTTTESEVIVVSRKRRKVAIFIMIFGNIFNVLIISVLINAAINMYQAPSFSFLQAILGVMAFMLLIVTYKKLPVVRTLFDRMIKKTASKIMFNKKSNPLLILDNFHGFCIAEIKVLVIPDVLKGITIFESKISNTYGMHVLFIKRGDEYIGYIKENERILLHDRVVIFGPLGHINKIFDVKPAV